MSKEDWKQTGTNMGHAWRDLGKTFARSADRVVEKATGDHPDNTVVNENGETIVEPNEGQPDSTVFSDGSWRNSVKGIGRAFKGVGQSAARTVHEAATGKDE